MTSNAAPSGATFPEVSSQGGRSARQGSRPGVAPSAGMIDIARLVGHANELAPLPASTVRLAQLVTRPDFHMRDVAELIAFDQALMGRILRVANSVAYASGSRVATVEDAVQRLGTSQVMALALAAGAKPFLQAKISAYGLQEGELWRHSVAAAVAAERTADFCQTEPPSELFAAALLHDVGKLVMGRFLSAEILRSIRRAQEVDGLDELKAETLILGVHHGELGGLVAQHWQLPSRVVHGVVHHHHPDEGQDIVCDFTYLANQVAKHIEAGLDGQIFEVQIPAPVSERLGLTREALTGLCSAATTRYTQVSVRYSTL